MTTETKPIKNLRRKGGAWYYDHGGNPRRYEPLGSDKAKALVRYHEIRNREPVKAGTVDAMVRDCIDYMERERKRAKPGSKMSRADGTIRMYELYRRYLGGVFGAMKPEHVTQGDVLTYLYDCPRMTFANEIGLLSMSYMYWMRTRGLVFNPCLGVKCDRDKSKRTRLITTGEIDAIVAKADERLAVAIELAYATGLRVGDLCRLRWQDLDGFETRKTGERLGYETTDGFDALLARARALQARVGSLYVLCDAAGRPFTRKVIAHRWHKARTLAGVPDVQFRDLRAAGATEKDRTEGHAAAQKFLGHRNAATTDRYLRGKRTTVVTPLTRKQG